MREIREHRWPDHGTASVLGETDATLAAKCRKTAKHIWDTEKLILPLKGILSTDASKMFAAQRQMAVEWNAAIELLLATGDEKYKSSIKALWPLTKVPNGQLLSFGGGGWKAVLALDHMGHEFTKRFKAAVVRYEAAYDASVAANPYNVGMWGGTTGVLDMGIAMYFLHMVAPHTIGTDYTLRAATYVLGTHPDNNTSWISGVMPGPSSLSSHDDRPRPAASTTTRLPCEIMSQPVDACPHRQ